MMTYFVDADADIKARDKIVAIIRKEIPSLRIVDDMFAAEIRLLFRSGVQDVTNGYLIDGVGRMQNERLPVGSGMVWINARGADKARPRVLMNFSSRQDGKLEKMPYEKFAKQFVKYYKLANRIK